MQRSEFLIPFYEWNQIIQRIQNKNEIVLKIKIHKINIVHARSRAPAWSAYFASKLANVKFVTTFHGTYNFKSKIKKFIIQLW